MSRMFGTDGVRGVANVELTPELAMKIGKAAAIVLTGETHRKSKILIGKDTRISSDMLEAALTAGICSVGADVVSLGAIPTPAVAYLVGLYNADAGIMISASHNPYEFNGIKIFTGDGYKLPDSVEDRIESLIKSGEVENSKVSHDALGSYSYAESAADDYIEHLKKVAPDGLDGIKIALDCACGSSSVTAEKLFGSLGAQCMVINNHPNGININDRCGSTHIDALCKFTRENGCSLGLAFDGDADRCLACDENGVAVDGDKLIAIIAKYLKENGRLKNNTAVVTVMSNLGFFEFCKNNGINVEKTKVGDRYVLEEMLRSDYIIGGEQSGHIIFKELATTGDGELTGVLIAKVLKESGKKMSELAGVMQVYPQVLVNIQVDNKIKAGLMEIPAVAVGIKEAEAVLGDSGRILVRASGTEPLVRVMIEGKDKKEIEDLANRIAEVIKNNI